MIHHITLTGRSIALACDGTVTTQHGAGGAAVPWRRVGRAQGRQGLGCNFAEDQHDDGQASGGDGNTGFAP